ncbi:MAG: hypothetical protein ACTS27_12445, partial [Phycisphaerales bacterium]
MPTTPTAYVLGIDEAGYGPFVGPLCLGASLFRVTLDSGGAPPCLWKALGTAVCRLPSESTARTPRLAVNDSKAIKRPAKPGPLAHAAALADLELSVLAFAALLDQAPIADDAALFARLGTRCLQDDAAAEPRPLPINHDGSLVALRAGSLRRAAERAGVSLVSYRVAALDAGRFNAECARLGSKASVAACLGLARLQDLWRRLTDADGGGAAGDPRVGYAFLDRQGGRTDYEALLAAVDPEADLATVERGPQRSAYTLRDGRRELRVLVEVGADSKRFPTALASMAAKYARDLAMLRFNARFTREFPHLKPTQGYGADRRRWISHATAPLAP